MAHDASQKDKPLHVHVEEHVHEIRNVIAPPTLRVDHLLARRDRGDTLSEQEYVDELRRLRDALARAHKSADVLADALREFVREKEADNV